jgi:alpha-2-macroglobulin
MVERWRFWMTVVHAIEVPAGGSVRVDWRVRAVAEGRAVIRMRALSDEESDAVQLTYPVYVHGMLKTESFSGVVRPDAQEQSIALRVPAERRPAQSLVWRCAILQRWRGRWWMPAVSGGLPVWLHRADAEPVPADGDHPAYLMDMGISLAEIRDKRTNLNAQEIGDDRERARQWQRWNHDPVLMRSKLRRWSAKACSV